MTESLPYLAGSASAVFFVLVMFAMIGLSIFWPVMLFLTMRNIRLIRVELERLNETLASKMTSSGVGPLRL